MNVVNVSVDIINHFNNKTVVNVINTVQIKSLLHEFT